MKAESFIRGAIFITFGALISRVLGAIYRPVAQAFIGDYGLALVTPPNNAYQFILAISAVGLNVAISRLVSNRLALKDYQGARHVFRMSTQILFISGVAFSILFALGARWMARVQGFPEAWLGFLVLSPAILLVTLECAFRGLYQGMQQMALSAVSQVIEQIGRVAAGLILIMIFAPISLHYGAAAFNAGSTVGVLLGSLYCGWAYFRNRPTAAWANAGPESRHFHSLSSRALIREILSISVPLSLLGAVLPLMGLVDSAIVTNRLLAIGIPTTVAQEALAYLGNAGAIRDLPSILTTALYVSLVPAVTESITTQRLDQAQYRASTAFRITFLIGIPATIALIVSARDVYSVLFTGPGYTVMGSLGWSTIFLMLQQTSSGVLQGMGRIWLSVRNLVISVILKMILTYWWTGIPVLGANGAAYATVVGFAAAAILNLWILRQELGLGIGVKNDIGRPALAGLGMGMAMWLTSPVVHGFIGSDRLAGLITLSMGGFVYLILIFAVKGVAEADLYLIPGVRPGMIESLRRYRLVRR